MDKCYLCDNEYLKLETIVAYGTFYKVCDACAFFAVRDVVINQLVKEVAREETNVHVA